MIKETFIIKNKLGLHVRPPSIFVQTASKFNSNVFIEKDGIEVNAKSLFSLITLVASFGTKINVKIDGSDELELFNVIKELIDKQFYEE